MRTYTRRMTTTRWWKYVLVVSDGAPGAEVARRAEFDPSAISRWRRGDRPDVASALKFARAYGRNVLEALVEAGEITETEAALHDVQVGVDDLTIIELLEAALNRVR